MAVTTDATTRNRAAGSSLRGLLGRLLGRESGIIIGFLLLCAVFAWLNPAFLRVDNLLDVALQSSITAVLAIGMTLVIITAGIDLSVGSVLAVAAYLTADLMARGLAIPVAVLAGLGVGAIAGWLNGVLITKGQLPPFIVTLGTMSLLRGVVLIYSQGAPVYGVPPLFKAVFAGRLFGVPTPVLIAGVIALLAYLALQYTPFGQQVIAIGGNEEAARLSGINVHRRLIEVYMIAGLLSGVAALILTGRLGAAEPISGTGYELNAIAAAVMGGASLAGGQGSILGTVIGALIMGSLQNGLTLNNVPAFYQQVAVGAVIIVAVFVDQWRRRKTS
jgi:ribose transport system permease protein